MKYDDIENMTDIDKLKLLQELETDINRLLIDINKLKNQFSANSNSVLPSKSHSKQRKAYLKNASSKGLINSKVIGLFFGIAILITIILISVLIYYMYVSKS